MTAKQYLESLKYDCSNLSEYECLQKLIDSHNRLRGSFLNNFQQPIQVLNDKITELLEKFNY